MWHLVWGCLLGSNGELRQVRPTQGGETGSTIGLPLWQCKGNCRTQTEVQTRRLPVNVQCTQHNPKTALHSQQHCYLIQRKSGFPSSPNTWSQEEERGSRGPLTLSQKDHVGPGDKAHPPTSHLWGSLLLLQICLEVEGASVDLSLQKSSCEEKKRQQTLPREV